MRQFEPVKVTMDYGPETGSSVWQQAGKMWRVNAVIGIIVTSLLSVNLVHLFIWGFEYSVSLQTGILYYTVPVLIIGLCWWRMIKKGGVAAWLWGLAWSGLAFLSLLILDPVVGNAFTIGMAFVAVLILLFVSQISVARRAFTIKRMQGNK